MTADDPDDPDDPDPPDPWADATRDELRAALGTQADSWALLVAMADTPGIKDALFREVAAGMARRYAREAA